MIYTTAQLLPRIIEGYELPEHTISLNITKSVNQYAEHSDPTSVLTPAHVMSFVQRAWVLAPEHANKAQLILATYVVPGCGLLILGAFVFGRSDSENPDIFKRTSDNEGERRYSFLAEPADDITWCRYVGHYLRPPKQGEANPVRYYEQK